MRFNVETYEVCRLWREDEAAEDYLSCNGATQVTRTTTIKKQDSMNALSGIH